jgi:integrase
MLAAWFGLRRGEAVGVRWSSINFETMTLRIEGVITNKGDGAPSEKEVFRNFAKTEESIRAFPLTAEAADYLKRLKQEQERNRILSGDCYNEKWADFVCVDEMGNLIHLDYITNMFSTTLKRLGLRPIRFHDLRHTNITLLLESGASMKDVQAWAGHKTLSTTMDTYAHVQAKSKQRLADMMSGIIGNC